MKHEPRFDMSAGFIPDSPDRNRQRPLPVSGVEIVVYALMLIAYTGIAMWLGALMAASFCD